MAIKKYYVTVDDFGTTRWYKDAKCAVLHREEGPAVEWHSGERYWYQNDMLHNTDGPAIEWPDGSKEWFQNGVLHREDGPAIEYADGYQEWWLNGTTYLESEYYAKLKALGHTP